MVNEPMPISSFTEALKQHPEAVGVLPPNTLWRYVNVIFPRMLLWLMCYPSLLRALAEDAERDPKFWSARYNEHRQAIRELPVAKEHSAAA